MMEPDASPSAVKTLEKLRFPELALSAYFPTDPGAGRNYYRALLEDLIKADFHKLDATERAALTREMPIVLAALEKRRFQCPAVAVFSCRPQGLLHIWRLAEPLAGRIAVARQLDLAPIRLQLFKLPPALAAVVNKQQARLFALVLDELTEVRILAGIQVRRHKQGGWSAAALQRRQDEHTRWNLGDVAQVVSALLKRDGYRRLLIAGPREARTEFKALLPPEARKLLAGEGTIPMQTAGNELARRLRGLDQASEVA
jgi:peptide chain release factor subunit 1